MKIKAFLRWYLAYDWGLCSFMCKYRGKTCKLHIGKLYFCWLCDNRRFDMCGHCINRSDCSFSRRQKYACPNNWIEGE